MPARTIKKTLSVTVVEEHQTSPERWRCIMLVLAVGSILATVGFGLGWLG